MTETARVHSVARIDAQATKRLAFKTLAEKRTNAILDKIRILGNLSNKSAYSYTEDDVQRIFRAIDAELRVTRGKFRFDSKRRFEL